MITTLTQLRNNLFSIADKLKENDETIIVGKRGKKNMVIISYERYIKLKNNIKSNDKKNKIMQFAGLLKDSSMNKMSNLEIKNELNKIYIGEFL